MRVIGLEEHFATPEQAVRDNPDRFQGFATLPTPDPHEATRELERGIRDLGLQGAMVFDRTHDKNLDHPDFWPIFEATAAMRAPLYLHPQSPQRGVLDAYYLGSTKRSIHFSRVPASAGIMRRACRISPKPPFLWYRTSNRYACRNAPRSELQHA